MGIRHTSLLALALICAGAVLPAIMRAEEPGADAAILAAGQKVFSDKCERCHDIGTISQRKAYGPNLFGVVGRKAGTLEAFAYSKALRESGLVWTEEQLRAWMANNTGLLPGTRMRHVGITDPGEQDLLLAYLQSLK